MPVPSEVGTVAPVVWQAVLSRRSDRGEHHWAADVRQVREKNDAPVLRPHEPADFARPLLARVAVEAGRAASTPALWRGTLSLTAHRLLLQAESRNHPTARAANAGRRLSSEFHPTPGPRRDPIRADWSR